MGVLGGVFVSNFFSVLFCLYRCCTITAVPLSFFFVTVIVLILPGSFFFGFCSLLGNTLFFFRLITFQN